VFLDLRGQTPLSSTLPLLLSACAICCQTKAEMIHALILRGLLTWRSGH
jgi:hypothetical protein